MRLNRCIIFVCSAVWPLTRVDTIVKMLQSFISIKLGTGVGNYLPKHKIHVVYCSFLDNWLMELGMEPFIVRWRSSSSFMVPDYNWHFGFGRHVARWENVQLSDLVMGWDVMSLVILFRWKLDFFQVKGVMQGIEYLLTDSDVSIINSLFLNGLMALRGVYWWTCQWGQFASCQRTSSLLYYQYKIESLHLSWIIYRIGMGSPLLFAPARKELSII